MDILSTWQINNRSVSAVYHVAPLYCIVLGFSFTWMSPVVRHATRSSVKSFFTFCYESKLKCHSQCFVSVHSQLLSLNYTFPQVSQSCPATKVPLMPVPCLNTWWISALRVWRMCLPVNTRTRVLCIENWMQSFSKLSVFFLSLRSISYFKLPTTYQNMPKFDYEIVHPILNSYELLFVPKFLNCLKHKFVFHGDSHWFFIICFQTVMYL